MKNVQDPFRPTTPTVAAADLHVGQELLQRVRANLHRRLVGQESLQTALLIGLLTGQAILLESPAGLGKATAVKLLADSTGGTFARIECTSDLETEDLLGARVFNQAKNAYEGRLGPIFSNFVILEEFDCAPAKVQSACLGLMEQRQATVEQMIFTAPAVFCPVAAVRPEQTDQPALTSPQLDRFYLKERLVYPSVPEETRMLELKTEREVAPAVISLEQVAQLQQMSRAVYAGEAVRRYIAEVVAATRQPENYLTSDLIDYIDTGASPRASVAFLACAQAFALLSGHTYVTPHHVQALRYAVLRHRLQLSFAAFRDEIAVEQVVDAIFNAVAVPG